MIINSRAFVKYYSTKPETFRMDNEDFCHQDGKIKKLLKIQTFFAGFYSFSGTFFCFIIEFLIKIKIAMRCSDKVYML